MPRERHQWILEYLRNQRQPASVDVYDRDFAVAYVDATGARCGWQPYGAPTVPQLGRDLSAMYLKHAMLTRARIGLRAMESGFAKWVWCYRLSPSYETYLHEVTP